MSEGGEKTEAPTQKRRQKAREDGQILRSRDLAAALVMMAGIAWLMFAGPTLLGACKAVMAASFQFSHADVEDFEPFRPLMEAGWKLLPSLASLFAVTIVATIASQAGLGSLQFNPKALTPKPSKLNPASGLKRIFGMQGWTELGKSLLKIVLLGALGGYMLWTSSRATLGLAQSDLNSAIGSLGGTFITILLVMGFGLVLIAGFDVPIQIFQLLSKLKMTKQEIKDEHKESEGNPEAKAHIRAKQREMSHRAVRAAVQEAHVILTNPTHFAVALRYERGKDEVPVVVAKGRGATALAIRELAAELATPVLEYPQLARAVYYTSREGQEVRADLYQAIAVVLAFVFGINAGAGGTAQPPVEVPTTARFDENGVAQP
ncbi:flagellar biosynthetic protein FlhB [Sphingomonas sp. S17]|jgi:flagellar biosynthetic protein FlhB|uniref:Flagellar biosynthesis protein FlhB n=2 Tax=Sphingomonas paucimobilis TaxID=13689 RepID=A0A411LK18_SPHPI|nr:MULTISPECIES: flagellar type III secretion system protein FlhB [Sphingomonas]EGI54101.1 flagellar biosynthetic protein FlhB [Sphingomonas sp. S17]MBQ1480288.1 flagellar biosynthesis protein FlhB [Sphingomonas sp.]MCM3678778.1 flagellar type III secretion system protein FlhB [Sphingomonas paucimobilis]MDG5969807.1 flagellar type III secretion system protein FlhB [Sphingomonas paucimobilis]NNG57457.1 flagellar biosynthesis protein FlhB [Sphingomonas paucimobilis]